MMAVMRRSWVALALLAVLLTFSLFARRALESERARTAQIAAISDLRSTATLYVQQILYVSLGQPADVEGAGTELLEGVHGFLEGSDVGRLQGSADDSLGIARFEDPEVRAKLQKMLQLADGLVQGGRVTTSLDVGTPEWAEALQETRTQVALLRSVVSDTVGQMSAASRAYLQLRLRMLLVLTATGIVGGSFALSKARRTGRKSETDRYEALVLQATDWVAVIDGQGRITYSTPAGAALFPEHPGLTGAVFRELLSTADHVAAFDEAMHECLGDAGQADVSCEVISGEAPRRLDIHLTDLRQVTGIHGVVANTRDVTEEHTFRDELQRRAFHDDLTGLANRALLKEHIGSALALAARSGRPPSLLYLDVDDFKTINDAYGHSVGDELLCVIAERTKQQTRPGDIVARLGGDEFAVLLAGVGSVEEVRATADRVAQTLRDPITLSGGVEIQITASMGVRTWVVGDDSAESFVRDADAAMYAAKSRDKGSRRVFDRSMHDAVVHRQELAQMMRIALDTGQFWLALQPQASADDLKLVGVEALLRWEHPQRGNIPPSDFISVAEDTGLIREIGSWVLEEAARQLVVLAAIPGHEQVTMSVNVSSTQLGSQDFLSLVKRVVAENRIRPGRLILEITESALLDDSGPSSAMLVLLDSLGVAISIDDFGTGYSSLSRLRSMPISELKVDRSFVIDAVAQDPKGRAVLRTIAALGQELGLAVVAEGVETEEQLHLVREAGVTTIQGYLTGRPQALDGLYASLVAPAGVLPT